MNMNTYYLCTYQVREINQSQQLAHTTSDHTSTREYL